MDGYAEIVILFRLDNFYRFFHNLHLNIFLDFFLSIYV